jgi:hypothetical protein
MCLVALKTQGVYPYSSDWIILEDLYLIRELEDRNKPRGKLNEMFLFSETINTLSLNEIVLQGRKFTCSNMHILPH